MYPRYLLAVVNLDGSYQLALAPDDKGRRLAAVFTYDDAFEAFLPEGEALHAEGQLLQVELAGPKLFEQLAQMSLDGLVFNCRGPARPIAFAQPFIAAILEAKAGE